MTWRKGWIEQRLLGKMDDHPVHTIPNHCPTKMDVLPKTFVQIILAAKWLMWHSSTVQCTSLNQQQSPLPALLSLSFSCSNNNRAEVVILERGFKYLRPGRQTGRMCSLKTTSRPSLTRATSFLHTWRGHWVHWRRPRGTASPGLRHSCTHGGVIEYVENDLVAQSPPP